MMDHDISKDSWVNFLIIGQWSCWEAVKVLEEGSNRKKLGHGGQVLEGNIEVLALSLLSRLP